MVSKSSAANWFKAKNDHQINCNGLFLKTNMARPEGFEPPTTWFVARYSIQLSYGRMRAPNYPDMNPRCQE